MKKVLSLVLAMTMVFPLCACGSSDDNAEEEKAEVVVEVEEEKDAEEEAPGEEAEKKKSVGAGADADDGTYENISGDYSGELIVFAAASMTETLEELGDLFMEQNPDVKIVFTFDSSGTLKTQIEEGADCDIFISAAQKQMDQLDITASEDVNTDGLDFVLSETRFDILENKVALAVPDGNPKDIQSFDDLAELMEAEDVFMAMGNEDVPVGQYTQEILEYYDLSEDELASAGCITYGSNVKEVTTAISEATVDCGIIYATDAFSAGLTVMDEADSTMCGQVIYPAAIMKSVSDQELAQAFLDFCTSETGSEVFESVGFTPLVGYKPSMFDHG